MIDERKKEMKKQHFEMESDGFYGAYWKCKTDSNSAVIAMIGDDPEDYMVRTAVKWLKSHGNQKVGIVGASTTGTLALTEASYFEDITLTIALTPSDFIWQCFMQEKKDGCKEWPVEEEPLPYMPFCYKHPEYWRVIEKETKRTGDMINSKKLFDDAEAAHPITEEELIKIERIHGILLLIGAEDDVLWDCAKYIRRMEQRMKKYPHSCILESTVYKYGTHFVFPESMLKTMFPVGSAFFGKLAFQSARKHPKECLETRLDIDVHIRNAITEWKGRESNVVSNNGK